MNTQRRVFPRGLLTLLLLAMLAPALARAADHLDSPKIKTNHQLDINDIYLFQSPKNKHNTVIIMTVVPLAGVLDDALFSSEGGYEIHVDNNGDTADDLVYQITFSMPNRKGAQKYQVHELTHSRHKIIARGTTGTVKTAGATAELSGGGKVQAGVYDDPFFFDLNAFNNFKEDFNPSDFCHPGSDFFHGYNVMAIIMEVPSVNLQSTKKNTNIALWGSTIDGGGEQFDRMGRPAINTALIPANLKDAFNAGSPSTDQAMFGSTVMATLTALGNPPAAVQSLTALLLPDMNTFDTSKDSGFPNGRELSDDVIDTEFGLLLSHVGVTTDCVGNDSNFRREFPYIAVANKVNP